MSYLKLTLSLYASLILDSGVIPEDWVLGLIVPIGKRKGYTVDCNNYRGITLLSCLDKLFTNVLNARLCKFCEDNPSLGETQAGFRRSYSTIDFIFLLKHIDLYCLKKVFFVCSLITVRHLIQFGGMHSGTNC